MVRAVALCLGALVFFSGCVKDIAVSTVGAIVDDGFEAFTEEQDLAFAEQALPANIKLLDVMLKNDPENARLLRLGSEGYNSYALAFLEDTDPERARAFYRRGKEYGMRILRRDASWARALDGTLEDLTGRLAEADQGDVPALFWTAFGWGSEIYLSLTSPDAIADLPKAEALMDFVARTDSTYYYAGADLFLGTLYGSRPKMLGGDLEKSRRHFDRALRLNGGRFLMTYVYYARSVAVQSLDEALFDELLAKVDTASLEILPKARLANQVAKRKSELLKSRKSDLF
jgi:tetratricopeptide (TPR) repeat protein